MEKEIKTYKKECPIEDCDVQFIGITFKEFIEHLEEEEHSQLQAKIHKKIVVGECPEHGIYELSGYGECPDCESVEE